MTPNAALEYLQLAMQGYERRINLLEKQISELYKLIRELDKEAQQ